MRERIFTCVQALAYEQRLGKCARTRQLRDLGLARFFRRHVGQLNDGGSRNAAVLQTRFHVRSKNSRTTSICLSPIGVTTALPLFATSGLFI
jgi:hypothetical protein